MPAVTRGSPNGLAGPSGGDVKGVGRSGVQRDRDLKRKSEASKEWNWASLYMNVRPSLLVGWTQLMWV